MSTTEVNLWLRSAKERYQEAKRILDSEVNDPPNEPHLSRHAAADIFEILLTEIKSEWNESSFFQITLVRELLNYNLGLVKYQSDDVRNAETLLDNSWENVKVISVRPECCILSMCILHALAVIWIKLDSKTLALKYLKESERIYKWFKSSNHACPYTLDDMFQLQGVACEEESWKELEKTYTVTCYALAQMYEDSNEDFKSAMYCYRSLQRIACSGGYDRLDFATKSATLSYYFSQKSKFEQARHLLSYASTAVPEHEKSIKLSREDHEAMEEIMKVKATVSAFWIKYCIELLFLIDKVGAEQKKAFSSPPLQDMLVILMEVNIPSKISSYEDARKVFLFGQEHISVAKTYYTLNHFASRYVELTLEHTQLYKGLIKHEPDNSRKCKMHKRQADMLEELIPKLNPQYYLDARRNMLVKLGTIYYEMASLKESLPNSDKKFNSLLDKSRVRFIKFQETVTDKDGQIPKVLPQKLVDPYLFSCFCIARSLSKIRCITPDLEQKNKMDSLQMYRSLIDYVKRNPKHRLAVAKEIAELDELLNPDAKERINS